MAERTIDTRDSITPRDGGSVVRGDTWRTEGIGRARSGEGRGITDAQQGPGPSASQMSALNELIKTNAPKTLSPFHANSATEPQLDTTNRSDAPGALYGTDDPFSILADLALRLFPNEETTPQTTYVPVMSGGGAGSSAGLVLLVVIIGGAGVWYYYKRKGAGNA